MCMIEWLVGDSCCVPDRIEGKNRDHADRQGKYLDRLRHPDVRDWLVVQPETAIC